MYARTCLIHYLFSLIWPLIAFWPQFLVRRKKCHSWYLIALVLTQSNLINIYCIQCFPFSDVFSFRIWRIYSWLAQLYIVNLKNRVAVFEIDVYELKSTCVRVIEISANPTQTMLPKLHILYNSIGYIIGLNPNSNPFRGQLDPIGLPKLDLFFYPEAQPDPTQSEF